MFSFAKVNAADPTGVCKLKANLDGSIASIEKVTDKDCHRMADDKSNAATFVSWTPDSIPPPSQTPTTPTPVDTSYHFLAPLPGQVTFDPTKEKGGDLGNYLNLMIKLFIGICAVLAVIMIVIGGLEYMTNELISHKEEGKKKILGAVFGLVLALGAWTLLYTINPDLLNTSLSSLENVTVEVTAQNFASSPSTYIVPLGKTGQTSGTNCDENAVAASNQTANAGLSNAQIHTLACIGGIETGCKSIQNYAWGSGSSAYGPFQILLQGNAGCFESNICRQAAGVSGPLNCAAGFHNGNPIPGSPIVEQCKKAANNFTCSVSAAACLIKKQPSYSDWNANPNLSKCK